MKNSFYIFLFFIFNANAQTAQIDEKSCMSGISCCMSKVLKNETKSSVKINYDSNLKDTSQNPLGSMVLIPGGVFEMGADNNQASLDEYPKHLVQVDSFYMDKTEVTNEEFSRFVSQTGYITVAERELDWDELKKMLPPNTLKPHDSLLQPSSLVFKYLDKNEKNLNPSKWWTWKKSANWKQPLGPGSSIIGKENHPVVQISFEDALAYCKWTGKRLPTEAEWEYAARGGKKNNIYPWGNESINSGKPKCNFFQGNFPFVNTIDDGWEYTSPVASFLPNDYGLFDMSGNVWEWCSDWYDVYYYRVSTSLIINPLGPVKSNDPEDIYSQKKVTRGGSFLCNDSYCSGYRVSRRMKSNYDTSLMNLGFRCVVSINSFK